MMIGPLGLLLFLLISGFWGLAFTGFSYAIALKTDSAAMRRVAFSVAALATMRADLT